MLWCAALLSIGSPSVAAACDHCERFDFLCCDVPADGRFFLTSFSGEGMACGGTADGTWYYATSWVRWHCGAKVQVTNPETGACVVVEVADAGPAAWVEERAGMPIIDASPLVCEELFSSSSCGWSDGFLVEVVEVDDATPTGAGGCVEPPPRLDAQLVGQGASAEPDPSGGASYRVCAGDEVSFWLELRNTGEADWVDTGATDPGAWGQAVRLGVPEDRIDPFAGTDRVSINDSSNPDVHAQNGDPPGGDCSDAPGCARSIFTVTGAAPATAGLVVSTWQLVDELRAWFGPQVSLSFVVEDCPAEPDGGGADTGPQTDAGEPDGGSTGGEERCDGGPCEDGGAREDERESDGDTVPTDRGLGLSPGMLGGCGATAQRPRRGLAWRVLLGLWS